MKQALLKISGRVQGVFYRASAQKKARQLNLAGYAKNLADGSVEALVQGSEADINTFIGWARSGPERARVKNIEVSWQPPSKEYPAFFIA